MRSVSKKGSPVSPLTQPILWGRRLNGLGPLTFNQANAGSNPVVPSNKDMIMSDSKLALEIKSMIEKVDPSDADANMKLVNEIYAKVHSLESVRISAFNATQPKFRGALD